MRLVERNNIEIIITTKEEQTTCIKCNKHIYNELRARITEETSQSKVNVCLECLKNEPLPIENISKRDVKKCINALERSYRIFQIKNSIFILELKKYADIVLEKEKECSGIYFHDGDCRNERVVFGGINLCTNFFKENDSIDNISTREEDSYKTCQYCGGSGFDVMFHLETYGSDMCKDCKNKIENLIRNNKQEIEKRLTLIRL